MKIKKILLIATPAFTLKSGRDINPLPPLGLGYLAAIIKKMGIEVRILDCLVHGWSREVEVNETLIRVGLSEGEIKDYISDFNPDVVGVNCQFSRQYKIYHRMFSLIKAAKPECVTLAGGTHVSVCPREVLEDDNCDFILIGEAEESIRGLLSCLKQGDSFDLIDGLGWKSAGKLHINEKKKWITDLDSLSFPDYELMGLENYFGLNASHGLRHRNKFSPIITSRGCPAKCTFCSAHKGWGDAYRFRSVNNVLEEMKLLKDNYGVEELMFEDDNVTANQKRAKELFSGMIKEGLGFIWDTPNGVGVWSIDEPMLDLMKQSGCIRLNFPVESGSQYVLDRIIKKPINLARVRQLIKYCQNINLDYGLFLVIGMPGEKIKDIWSSFKFAAECACYGPHISVATPYPGTKIFEQCQQNGFFSGEFKLDNLFIRSFMIRTPDWSEDDLKKVLSHGLLYLKIKSLLADPKKLPGRLLRVLRNPYAIFNFFRDKISFN